MKLTLLTLIMTCIGISAYTQTVPPSTSYQAVARDGDGEILINANLGVRASILEGSFDGALSWEETHSVQTNEFGLFSLEIGLGSSTGAGSSASYIEVDWPNADHFLMIEIDPGDGIYELIGVSQLLAVPYAYHARTVEIDNVDDADADPSNELIDDFLLIDQVISLTENGEVFEIDLAEFSNDEDWVLDGDVVYNDQQNIGINTSTPNSTMEINGSFSRNVNYISISDDLTINLGESDHTIIADLNGANMNIILPLAQTCPGREYIIKVFSEMAVNNVIISNGTDQIDGEDDLVINGVLKESAHLISTGDHGWIIIY